MVTDPLAYFPRDKEGWLQAIFHRIPTRLINDALALGWMPLPPNTSTYCDEHVVWCAWIPCSCGRTMPVPR